MKKKPIPPLVEIDFTKSLQSLSCIIKTADIDGYRGPVYAIRSQVLRRLGEEFDSSVRSAIEKMNSMDGGSRATWIGGGFSPATYSIATVTSPENQQPVKPPRKRTPKKRSALGPSSVTGKP